VGKEGSGRLAGRGNQLCKDMESWQAQGSNGRWTESAHGEVTAHETGNMGRVQIA